MSLLHIPETKDVIDVQQVVCELDAHNRPGFGVPQRAHDDAAFVRHVPIEREPQQGYGLALLEGQPLARKERQTRLGDVEERGPADLGIRLSDLDQHIHRAEVGD